MERVNPSQGPGLTWIKTAMQVARYARLGTFADGAAPEKQRVAAFAAIHTRGVI